MKMPMFGEVETRCTPKPLRCFVQLNTWFRLFLCASLSSCVPVEKLIYLQEDTVQPVKEVFTYENVAYSLQSSDILDVTIASMNPEVNELFNTKAAGNIQMAQASTQNGGDLYYMSGYSISKQGEIDLPIVGKVNVIGLTLDEAKMAIDNKVKEYFTNYHLSVKLGGVRFSALGEFNQPGKKVVMQNQVTIFEAIALGGDLSTVANRQSVKLIRQYPEGTRIHHVNLLDQSVIGGPHYFIQPNDVIYVEPLPQRSWGIGITGAQTLSTIIGTLSTSAALILSIISLTR